MNMICAWYNNKKVAFEKYTFKEKVTYSDNEMTINIFSGKR